MPKEIFEILILYLVIINSISFFLYFSDKRKACRHKYRISERNLIIVGMIGGALGSVLGMYLWHHKIRNYKFVLFNFIFLSIWIIIVVQCYKVIFLVWK